MPLWTIAALLAVTGFGAVSAMVSSGELKPRMEMIDRIWRAKNLDEVLDRIAEFRRPADQEGN